MSARPGIVANAYVPADGGESPNQFKPYVSAEIRCHWPPLATDHEIGKALDGAMHDAFRQIAAKRGTASSPIGRPWNEHPHPPYLRALPGAKITGMNRNDHCTLCPFQTPENCPDCPHRHYRGGDDHHEPPTLPLW